MLLLSAIGFAQNSSEWDKDYYGSGKYSYSNNLTIAVGDSISGAYYVNNTLFAVIVDSNWTTSGLGFMVYNELESEWYPVQNSSGIVEYAVTIGMPVLINQNDAMALKYIKFYKVTSGTDVEEATTASKIEIFTGKY